MTRICKLVRSILARYSQKTKSRQREIYLNDTAQYVSIEKTFTLIVAFVIRNEDGVIVQRKLLVPRRTSAADGQGGNLFPCSCAAMSGVLIVVHDLSGFPIVPLSFRERPS
jgi:hypothetical protein